MTVCIGALFKWDYAVTGQPPDMGWGVLTVSDRMITAGDVQYEPSQLKLADLAPNVVLLIAGDYSVHSQALRATLKQLSGRPSVTPHDAAVMYGNEIQAISRKMAEDVILAPLHLNTDSFLAQQKDMAEHFVSHVTNQLQSFERTDVQALVLGLEGPIARIYEVDKYGSISSYDDVGFAAVGIGASHARLVFMQSGYVNNFGFAPALSVAFAAKKAAETAPGVGKATDINLILRSGRQPLIEPLAKKLERLYNEYAARRLEIALDAIRKLSLPDAETDQASGTQTADSQQTGETAPAQGSDGAQGSGAPSSTENGPEAS